MRCGWGVLVVMMAVGLVGCGAPRFVSERGEAIVLLPKQSREAYGKVSGFRLTELEARERAKAWCAARGVPYRGAECNALAGDYYVIADSGRISKFWRQGLRGWYVHGVTGEVEYRESAKVIMPTLWGYEMIEEIR